MSMSSLNPNRLISETLCRRWFLGQCGIGLAGIAINSLLSRDSAGSTNNERDGLQVRTPHYPAKVKRVIFMFQAGGPSHLVNNEKRWESSARAQCVDGAESQFEKPCLLPEGARRVEGKPPRSEGALQLVLGS